ncbi:UNVERIFIED_CONTAM: hypothetical protein K2H54_051494 [Gekko kuhli]
MAEGGESFSLEFDQSLITLDETGNPEEFWDANEQEAPVVRFKHAPLYQRRAGGSRNAAGSEQAPPFFANPLPMWRNADAWLLSGSEWPLAPPGRRREADRVPVISGNIPGRWQLGPSELSSNLLSRAAESEDAQPRSLSMTTADQDGAETPVKAKEWKSLPLQTITQQLLQSWHRI